MEVRRKFSSVPYFVFLPFLAVAVALFLLAFGDPTGEDDC